MGTRDHPSTVRLSGWGRVPSQPCVLHRPGSAPDLAQLLRAGPVIARGAGRAYGDSALQPEGVISTGGLGRAITLDSQTGMLEAEAGARFADVLAVSVPQGWFPPVTPGTKFVTMGGAVAADVHGKNHHAAGSFGDHLQWFDLMGAEGETRRCTPKDTPALFEATVGGMGLTGVVQRIGVQMIPVESAWIRQETVLAPSLDAAFEAFEASAGWTYSVAWIDALAGGARLGRTVLMRGEHARRDEIPAAARAAPLALPPRRTSRVPVDLPGFVLNKYSAKAFNSLYWAANARKTGQQIVDYDRFFYPLDALLDWNRVYGRRGFMQYQCVLPLAASAAGLRALLEKIRASGEGAFLAVLKLMGPGRGTGLSFPMEGYTLALDFPVTRRLPALLQGLDAIVRDHGGRLYLAKDARMSAETFRQGYDGLDAFEQIRRGTGAAGVFRSTQSERLGLS